MAGGRPARIPIDEVDRLTEKNEMESVGDPPHAYEDLLISIHDGILEIKHYYFPTGTKRVDLPDIRSVRRYTPTARGGRWRLWGSGDPVHWFNLDPARRGKQHAFVIDVGKKTKPIITPDDPAAFHGR